jgi:hypothetical protein
MSIVVIPGLYLEQKNRRNEIAMYFFPRIIESVKLFLAKRHLLPNIPGFILMLNALTWAIIAETHSNK